LISTAEGEIEVEDGVLVIKRIRVHYMLKGCPPEKRDAAERALPSAPLRAPAAP